MKTFYEKNTLVASAELNLYGVNSLPSQAKNNDGLIV